MLDRIFGPLTRFAMKHGKLISIAAAIWFWTGIAIYARFIELPDIPTAAKQAFFWSSVAANAAWWGFVRPQIDQRRKALEAGDDSPDRIE